MSQEPNVDQPVPEADGGLPKNLIDWVTFDPDGTYTLRLSLPVTHGKESLNSIRGRRPCARHMRDMPLGDPKTGHLIDVFSRSSGTPAVVVDQMDAADSMRVVTLMGFFMGDGLPIGPT